MSISIIHKCLDEIKKKKFYADLETKYVLKKQRSNNHKTKNPKIKNDFISGLSKFQF